LSPHLLKITLGIEEIDAHFFLDLREDSMNTKWIKRFLMGLGCALVLASATAVITQAQTEEPQIRGGDCQDCHEPITALWEGSTHSQASAESVFLSAWREAGSPTECLACHTTGFDFDSGTYETEGVSCQVCHPSAPDEHPQKIMFTDTSSKLCGRCHVDTFNQLTDSVHGQEGMDCIRCHNPHDNGLRAGGVENTCYACHREETHFYSFTGHGMEGLLCTDCHLQLAEGTMGEGHGRRLHTFTVGQETCTECHSDGMHYPLENGETASQVDPMMMEAGIIPAMGDVDSHKLESEPQTVPNSSLNFIILAAITGMMFGLIGSPWIEKQFRPDGIEDES
jgi:hypothetical protein